MPYIKQEDRVRLQKENEEINTAGELNYSITKMIDMYLRRQLVTNYASINEVIGVLECAKLELYRRVASPYEDMKIEENRDVYTINRQFI